MVNDTGRHAIIVLGTPKVRIHDNEIGTLSGAKNIGWSGIKLHTSDGTLIGGLPSHAKGMKSLNPIDTV